MDGTFRGGLLEVRIELQLVKSFVESLDVPWVSMLKINASPYAIGYYPFPNLLEEAWQDAEASTLGLMST